MMDVLKLDKFQDALSEVGNIGSGKASGAMARLTSKEVKLLPPEIFITSVSDIPNLIGGPQELVVGIYSSISGDVSGTVLIVLPTKSALGLVDLIQKKKPGTTKALARIDQVALSKAGKEISAAYIKTITDFLKLKVKTSPGKIISTFGESLPDFALIGIEERFALLLRTRFEIKQSKVNGNFVMIVAIKSINKLLSAIQGQLDK